MCRGLKANSDVYTAKTRRVFTHAGKACPCRYLARRGKVEEEGERTGSRGVCQTPGGAEKCLRAEECKKEVSQGDGQELWKLSISS